MSSCRDKESMNVVCSNCESALSTMLCVDCIENERYLCENCAEMHTKVKIYKKHRIYMPCAVRNKLKEPVSESAIPPYIAALSVSEYFTAPQCGSFASFCRHVEQWEHQLDDLDFDDVTNTLGLSDGLSMRGALACFFIALSVHILTKYVLGRRAIFATIGVGIVIYRFIKRRQNSYLSELGKIKQVKDYPLNPTLILLPQSKYYCYSSLYGSGFRRGSSVNRSWTKKHNSQWKD